MIFLVLMAGLFSGFMVGRDTINRAKAMLAGADASALLGVWWRAVFTFFRYSLLFFIGFYILHYSEVTPVYYVGSFLAGYSAALLYYLQKAL